MVSLGVLCLTAETGLSGDPQTDQAAQTLARQILQTAGVPAGLIVQVGGVDARLAVALRANDRYLVQCLDTDAEKVRAAREQIQACGGYGSISVDGFDGRHLPYVDNTVNLVLVRGPTSVDRQELLRVLCPGGVAFCTTDHEQLASNKITKPWPEDVDQWTHYLHDPSGNPVARDQRVGPPRHLQWTADPPYARSHEHLPSIEAMVSTGGRIFYIADQAAAASIRQPARWELVARDASNGLLLWQVPVPTWFPHIVNWGATPPQLQRRLVAVADRVYVTLGLHAPLSAVDAATGRTVKVYDGTLGAEEILCHQGILLLVVRRVTEQRVAELAQWARLQVQDDSPVYVRDTAEALVARLRRIENEADRSLLAVDAETGRILWHKTGEEAEGLRPLSLCAEGERVFYQNARETVGLDLQTGRPQWSVAASPLRLVCDGSVYCADGSSVSRLSAQTGQTVWKQATKLSEVRDVFVTAGSVWVGGFKPIEGKRGPSWGPYFVTQCALADGRLLRHVEPENPGHHHRCYSSKATERYILGGRRGTEFIDLGTGEVLWNSWARGVCRYGVMPANGLLYVPPHACGCYVAAKLIGFNALAAERMVKAESGERKDEDRLTKGPAYGETPDPSSLIPRPPTDWPTYRYDAQRSGRSPCEIPRDLQLRWQAEIGGGLSSLTAADGRVCVAAIDRHAVIALDAESGCPAWRFTAAARVDSPPTLDQGHALFGCRDGSVYRVRGSDGVLAWRLQAGRETRRIVVRGQLEAASPVPGSLLVQDGKAYFTAGRSSYLDGGIDLHCVEPASGKLLSTTPIYSPDPQTGRQPPQSAPAVMPGAREDLLSSDAGHVYLRDLVFDLQGAPLTEGNQHLFTLTGFLDDAWSHRSYWIFGTQCSLATGCSGRDKNLLYGRLLVFDEAAIYGFGRKTVHWSNALEDGPYRLFAVKRDAGTRQWEQAVPIQVRALLLAGGVLYAAGPVAADRQITLDPQAPVWLLALAASDGRELARYPLDAPPVFDGLAAARGRLYAALENGRVVCLGPR
jgi:outer membrane protein assembly factor BamB